MEPALNHTISLTEWTRRISEEEMPVFSHTAHSIASASDGDETPIAALSQLILRDSTMTARILRLANSVHFNPGNNRINTISRAIVLLGFNVVRNMALSIAILDPLLKRIEREHVLEEMARSIHAAVQARNIAFQRRYNDPEAVFVAALLSRLGNMAFWCFPNGHASELDKAYHEWDTPAKAETAVLGFSLKQLSMSLNQEWNLSSILNEYFQGTNKENKVMLDLAYTDHLISAIEEGWGGASTKDCIKTISDHIGLSIEETTSLVKHGAHEAARTASEYGVETASKLIPLPDIEGKSEPEPEDESTLQVRQQLQMDIIRELTAMLHEKAEINAILGTIMEGIYRALGMERAILAFVMPKTNSLTAKFSLGDEKEKFKKCFDFDLSKKNIFSTILKRSSSFWLNDDTRSSIQPLLTDDIKSCLDSIEFFAIPISVNGQGRGLIYADNRRSGRKLTREDFQTFTHFGEYASIAFGLLASNPR